MPLLQKRIILRCLEAGKPVITATQMLESMIEHAEPTRAEASDVANAILDGTSARDALGRDGGRRATRSRRCGRWTRSRARSSRRWSYRHETARAAGKADVGRAMSNAACDLAETLGAKAILVADVTGRTASAIARLRPRRPMIGLSHDQAAVQQMALEWGVLPLLMPSTTDVEDLWTRTIETARASRASSSRATSSCSIAGTAVNLSGSTNVIKVDIA